MARTDWAYVNVEKPLIESVDKAVDSIFIQGSRKYSDRKDFVTKALQKLLQEENPEVVA